MGSYKIRWKSSARKELKKLPKDVILKVIDAVEDLVKNPYPTGCRKIIGAEITYRIRVGNYRILYSVEKNNLIILIIRVSHRRDVYKNLP